MISVKDMLDGKYDADKIVKKQSELICELVDKFGGLNLNGEEKEQIVKSKQFVFELNSILNVHSV